MRKNSGFTLVELMVVLIVIGTLVSIALPSYSRSVERARCSTALNTLKSMRNAAISFYRANNTFVGIDPGTLGTLVGGNFADTPHWTYFIVSTPDTFAINADRTGGHWAGTTITLDHLDSFAASSYPYDDPGNY